MKRLIGYGYTNSSGVATMTKDASGGNVSGYTGTGAGLMNFRAEMHDDSTVVSTPYPVLDATFKDMGTSSDYGAWTNWTGYEPKLTRDTYCKVEVDTGKTDARMYKQVDVSNNDVCIEFDVKQVTSSASNVWATLRNNSVAVLGNVDMSRFSSFGGAINEWIHFKFVIGASSVKVYVNDNTTPYNYNAGGVTRFYFQINTSTTELDYKNFVIYPV